jgi:transcriptional regulator GlxA family with amidase domain
MRIVVVLALDNFVASDVAVPCDAFEQVRVAGVPIPYKVRVCGSKRRLRCAFFGLVADFGLEGLEEADTIVVAGIADLSSPIPHGVVVALKKAAARGCRIASVCTGAFVLAAAGLLDGQRGTTHWLAAAELARRYPKIVVDPNVLFVDNGLILTSAGASAGLDMCLHMVRADHGAVAAAAAARLAVVPLVREGGQRQFMANNDEYANGASLSPLLDQIKKNLHEPLTLSLLAERAAMSTRTLTRRFLEQTGTSPLQWLGIARVRRAQQLLESTNLSVEDIATEVGFGSATAFRDRFRRVVGVSPQRHKTAFGSRVAESAQVANPLRSTLYVPDIAP